jgi:hypothetical protein
MFKTLLRTSVFAFATLAVVVSAQQAPPPPAPAGPTHEVLFDVNGQTYSGVTTFVVDKAGKVTGKMSISSPATINGQLNGEIKDGTWKFDYPFTMVEQNCSGTVAGTAKVTAGQAEISGSVTIAGGCGTEALTGTFSFKKKAATK